jgi:ABC-type polysaccharide/polyol phosphate transport system ATPase subunit
MASGTTSVQDLSKTYGSGEHSVAALKGVSFEFGPGASLSIIGRNGAGKSTLLQLIAGVLAPSSGSIRRPARIASMLELGSGFHPDLTGRENLELGLAIAGLTTDRSSISVDEIVEFSELGDALTQPVKHYSDGMKARLACSIGVHTSPDLLIVDEVLAVGDASFQRQVLSKVHELLELGSSLLLVTHSVELARTTERAIWLDDGQVFRDGPTAAVLDEYEATSSSAKRYATVPNARVERLSIDPPKIEPGEGFTATARIRRLVSDIPVYARADLRPVVGEEPWMRKETELPEHRDLNLVATTGPQLIEDIGADLVEIVLRIESLPITATRLEVSLVLADESGAIHDELMSELKVGHPPGRVGYLMRITPSSATDAGSAH